MMEHNRREFIVGTAMAGATALAAGCRSGDASCGGESSMAGFRAPPMDRIRVAMVGVGGRGFAALNRLALIPHVEITALCDLKQEMIDRSQKSLAEYGRPKAKEYLGPEAYRRLAQDGVADVFYNCTPRDIHTELNVYAMDCRMHVLTEVPSGRTVEECWQTVETCEKNRVHCMMLENCCYGEYEMLALNIVRQGLLGEIVQCDGAYIHDQRKGQFAGSTICWRLRDMVEKYGNYYPTHGLGPICKCLDINRGDRMDYLVSMSSASPSFEGMARSKPKGSVYDGLRFNRGDVNFTLIRTARGRIISLQHSVALPRPYDRINQIVGTKGIMRGIKEQDYYGRIEFEKLLMKMAIERNLPIVGFCHGHQCINLYFGGTLTSVPKDASPKIVHHGDISPYIKDCFHAINIKPGSRLAEGFGTTRMEVNTSHTKCVKDVGEGLEVTARSDDGVVEAIEHRTLPITGFQFHPERIFRRDPRYLRIIVDALERRKE